MMCSPRTSVGLCRPADAYDMVSDPVIRSSISDLVTRLVDFLSGH